MCRDLIRADEIRDFVDAHLAERITLEAVSRGCGLTIVDVRASLGAQAGKTLQELVATRRIERIAEFVVQGAKIEWAIRQVGLTNWNNVVVQCRRRFGCAPHELRAAALDETPRR